MTKLTTGAIFVPKKLRLARVLVESVACWACSRSDTMLEAKLVVVQSGLRTDSMGVLASDMAAHAQTLVEGNHMTDRIEIVRGRIEEIELKEKVDVIVSEPSSP